MSPRLRIVAGLCGIFGAIALVSSFIMNPAPPAEFTVSQLRDFAVQHHNGIVFGAWLQGMGSQLLALFAIALVHLAGATHQFAGWVTLLAGATILMVSLVEITFYLGAVQAAEAGDLTNGTVSNALIKAVQHVFLIAPALLLPVGAVLLGAQILPRVFAYLALAIGATLQIFGLVGLFGVLQPVIDDVLIVQAIWFVAAGVAVLW
ncbi:hypothetical protein [Candidatus Binatus sp.]|uniref:hypothetical protein n=2 Tax=Candidatus Binatus sp. TaxID=2811406 RepID=UPI003CC57409